MRQPFVTGVLDIDPRPRQAVGVGSAFVTKRVVSRREKSRGRKVFKVGTNKRRGPPINDVVISPQIVSAGPFQERPAQRVAISEGFVRRRGKGKVQTRNTKQL